MIVIGGGGYINQNPITIMEKGGGAEPRGAGWK
jgi:hypothetical protein